MPRLIGVPAAGRDASHGEPHRIEPGRWLPRRAPEAEVAALIERKRGVRYHPGHGGRPLDSWGLSAQKPERRSHQRDAATIRQQLTERWPAIKQSRAGWRRDVRCASSRFVDDRGFSLLTATTRLSEARTELRAPASDCAGNRAYRRVHHPCWIALKSTRRSVARRSRARLATRRVLVDPGNCRVPRKTISTSMRAGGRTSYMIRFAPCMTSRTDGSSNSGATRPDSGNAASRSTVSTSLGDPECISDALDRLINKASARIAPSKQTGQPRTG